MKPKPKKPAKRKPLSLEELKIYAALLVAFSILAFLISEPDPKKRKALLDKLKRNAKEK